MAEDKKGFILYADQKEIFDLLTIEQRGQLITTIFQYVNDENPKVKDTNVLMAFTLIKQVLKRDLKKYEQKKVQWSEAGKASAKARRLKKERSTESTDVKSRSTESTVIDNVTVKDTVIDNVNDINKREAEFKNSLRPFLDTYGKDLLNEFFLYWTEKKPKGKKMRFEMQKVFDISRRLVKWNKNSKKFDNNKSQKDEELREIGKSIREGNPSF